MKQSFTSLAVSLATLLLVSACAKSAGSSPPPSPASTAPASGQLGSISLKPEQQARFDQTMRSVAIAIHWNDSDAPGTQSVTPTPTPTATPTPTQLARQKLGDEVKSVCKFTPINNVLPPTDTSLIPKLSGAKFTYMTTGDQINGSQCPIRFLRENSNYIAYILTTDPDLKGQSVNNYFNIKFKPMLADAKSALDIQDYELKIYNGASYRADLGSTVTGNGSGSITSKAQGTIGILAQKISTVTSDILNETSILTFTYSDGSIFELRESRSKDSITAPPTAIYSLNNNAIDQKTYDRYIGKLGLDKHNEGGI